ncbi:type IV pilus biogenesis protein PilP [Lelliottia amnigena]|uniref:type IV pilus biogenesis protein PilP n=1 Tax=Lelliottia amnigena TaxID=61646 RepID=UPI0020B283EA|nr:type IV pilus biogenesis protein PilP [Lelliottia amnigena]
MRQRNNALPSVTLLCLMIAAALPAQASESATPPGPSVATMGELEALQTRNILLQAKVQAAQLERQLKENLSNNTPSDIPAPGTVVGYSSLPGQPPRTAPVNSRPVVLEINGRDKNLRATLQLSSGQTVVVAPGNRIPGQENTVRSITIAGVTLSDGSLLAFGD